MRNCLRCVVLLLALMLSACSEEQSNAAVLLPLTPAVNLPAPSEVAAEPHQATAAEPVVVLHGANFLPELLNRVEAVGALGRFDPNYTSGPEITNLAHAIYQFDATGLSGSVGLISDWHIPPDAGNVMIGMADWDLDRWEWHSLTSLVEPLPLDNLSDYIHPEDGRLLALVMLFGTSPAYLTDLRLQVGEGGPYWRLSQLGLEGIAIHDIRMNVLQGKPIVTYWHDGRSEEPPFSKLELQRATDEFGKQWEAPEVIWDIPLDNGYIGYLEKAFPLIVEDKLSLVLQVRGDDNEWLYRVHYIIANDAAATSFAAPTQVVEAPDAYHVMDAVIVDGLPAFLGYDQALGDYFLRRADSAEGSVWSSFDIDPSIDETNDSFPKGLLMADGNVAALYPVRDEIDNSIWFRRANVPDASAWDAPVRVLGPPGPLQEVSGTTLADGRPAILYGQSPTFRFIAANDLAGTSWPAEGNVVPDLKYLARIEAETIGGIPALTYENAYLEYSVHYRQAADPLGATWQDPQVVYRGHVNQDISLIEVGGHPALAAVVSGDAPGRSYAIFSIYR